MGIKPIPSWHEYYIRLAYLVSNKSKDNSSKIGSVLVGNNFIVSAGFNGMPIGVYDGLQERQSKPEKYFWYEHSERNCLYGAARNGLKTAGCELFTLSIPCSDCARGLIQSGIVKITYHFWHNKYFSEMNNKWEESSNRSLLMLSEAGVEVESFNGQLGIQTLIGGKIFNV